MIPSAGGSRRSESARLDREIEEPVWQTGSKHDGVSRQDELEKLVEPGRNRRKDGRELDKVATWSYSGCMRCVGVKTLKNKLSEYLRLVAAGERILVTDRDRVIAEVIPPEQGRSLLSSDAVLAEAVRKGSITPAVLSPGSPPPRLPVARIQDILHELEGDRTEK